MRILSELFLTLTLLHLGGALPTSPLEASITAFSPFPKNLYVAINIPCDEIKSHNGIPAGTVFSSIEDGPTTKAKERYLYLWHIATTRIENKFEKIDSSTWKATDRVPFNKCVFCTPYGKSGKGISHVFFCSWHSPSLKTYEEISY